MVLADVRPALVTVVFSGTVVGRVGIDIPKLPGSKLVLVACGADSGAPCSGTWEQNNMDGD